MEEQKESHDQEAPSPDQPIMEQPLVTSPESENIGEIPSPKKTIVPAKPSPAVMQKLIEAVKKS